MTSKHIKCRPREEVAICTQWHLVCSFALICNHTIQRRLRVLGFDYLDVDFEPDGERETYDIESGAYVGGGTGNLCYVLDKVSIGWRLVALMVIIMFGTSPYRFVGQWQKVVGFLIYLCIFREFLLCLFSLVRRPFLACR
jgi:hypothetical protein